MLRQPPVLPVRVNPVLLHPHELRQPLARDWRFRLDPDDTGLDAKWFRHPEVIGEPISVPGCWQGQGFGGEGEDEVWDFRLQARVFRATYQGTGWYATTFGAPADWQHRRLWLNFGGVHPSAQVWLNGQFLGEHGLPFVPFGFEVTGLLRTEGDNDLVVRVHEANRLYGLAYNWQGNWSGLYRAVELTATGTGRLTQLRLYPDVDTETLRVVGFADGAPDGAVLRMAVSALEGSGAPLTLERPLEGGAVDATVATPGPRLWSPDSPQLYRVEAELWRGNELLDALTERTGFLKLATDGGRFLINDEPYYVRGSGDFLSCPETGSPDTDRDRWRRKLQALRDYGYNQVRCQSYVYGPEYYEAADEVGLLIQSEMGLLGAWGSHSQWHVYGWPAPTPDHYRTLKRQWDLVVERDVNHPSAAIYCMSNELGANTMFPRAAWRCYEDTKAMKPGAFVIWTDGGYHPDLPGDFVNVTWPADEPPPDKPLIEHEYRWWSSFPDVRLASKYNGAVRPYAAWIARAAAARRGQEHLLEAFATSSQRLQALEMKAKMEQCRRDRPFLAGISHFNAMDANPSPQGVITEFYEQKLLEASTWLQTNGDTVLLCGLDFADRVLVPGTEFRCLLHVSDFSHPPFAQPEVTWRLAAGEREIASGVLHWSHEAYTTCRVGEITCRLPEVAQPERLQLAAEMREKGRVVRNAWDVWLFPSGAAAPQGLVRYGRGLGGWVAQWQEVPEVSPEALKPEAVLLTSSLDEAVVEHLRNGGRAILAAAEGLVRPHNPNFGYVRYFFTPPANYAPYEDGQNGTVIREHPALGGFPHEGFADWPFFRMIEEAPPLDLEPLGLHDEDPIIRVIHRYPVLHPLGYLVERSVGAGRLLITALKLDPEWAEARYLLEAMCQYLGQATHPLAREASELTLARLNEWA